MDPHALARELLDLPHAKRDERLARIAGTPQSRELAWALWELSGSAWTREPQRLEEAADCVGLLALWQGGAELATLGEHGAATDTAALLVDRLARTSQGYHASIAALAAARALAWKADFDAAQRCMYRPPDSGLCGR